MKTFHTHSAKTALLSKPQTHHAKGLNVPAFVFKKYIITIVTISVNKIFSTKFCSINKICNILVTDAKIIFVI